jgi:hypothetical protein
MAGSPLLAILSGLANVPQQAQAAQNQRQDRAMAVQDQQAKLKEQQAQTELLQANAAGAKQKQGNDFLMQVAQMVKARPELGANPASVSRILAQAKQMGVDPSVITKTDDKGTVTLDPTALLPSASMNDMTDQERMQYSAMDPQTRQAVMKSKFVDYDKMAQTDQWKAFINEQPYSPVTATERVQLEKLPLQLAADVGSGKTPPAQYRGVIEQVFPRMKAAGLNPEYLLSPENLNQQVSKLTQAQIDKDEAAGLHWKNLDATARANQERLKGEFGVKEADRRYEFNIRDMRAQAAADRATTNLGIRMKELDNANRRLDMAAQDQSIRMTATQQAVYNRAYQALRAQYDPIKREHDRLLDQQINLNAQANGRYKPDQATTDRLKQMNDQLYEIGTKLQKAQKEITNAPAAAITGVTGQRAQPATSANLPATQVQGGKTYYLWSDGNYHTKKPS